MVRKYTRKTSRGDYSTEQVEAAVKAVLGGLKLTEASKRFSINKMTLNRYVKKLLKDVQGVQEASSSGKVIRIRNKAVVIGYTKTKRLFSTEEESLLVDKLKRANDRATSDEVRREAYRLAVKLEKDIPKTWTKSQMASYDWLTSFLARRKDITVTYKRNREQHKLLAQ